MQNLSNFCFGFVGLCRWLLSLLEQYTHNNKLTFVLHTVLRAVFVLNVQFHKQCGM